MKAFWFYATIVYILIHLAYCDYKAIVEQIDTQTQLKRIYSLQKNKLLNNLVEESDILKKIGVAQNSIIAAKTYASYYADKTKCESLNYQSGFIDKIPNERCPLAPLSQEAKQLQTLSLKLVDQKYIVEINQKLVNQQTAFNAVYFSQSGIYSKLTQAAFVPLQEASKKLQQCMKKYATTANPTPKQCKSQNEALKARQDIYGTYRFREVTFGMGSKVPVLSFQMKKGILTGSIENVNRIQTSLQSKSKQFKDKYNKCIDILKIIKIKTDADLQKALLSINKFKQTNNKLNVIIGALQNLLTRIKIDTKGFSPLVVSLKKLFPSQ